MTPQQICAGKDKRLLVLLAFGVLILLSRFVTPTLSQRQEQKKTWAWVECPGTEHDLHRVSLSESGLDAGDASVRMPRQGGCCAAVGLRPEMTAQLRRHGAIAVHGAEEGAAASASVSPRLALLLSLPFPINRASVDELTLLQGIGPVLAARIVSFRDQYGLITDDRIFRSVPGIGIRLAARISPQLSFE